MEAAKKHAVHGLTGFDLTKKTLYNLKHFKLTANAKLVLTFLTVHYNEKMNGAVVFPSMPYIAENLGLSLSGVKQAMKDLINEGLIIKSKRDKVRGNYNKYLITPKVQNPTSEQSENELLKSTESDLFMITNKKDKIKEQTNNVVILKKTSDSTPVASDYQILKKYALQRGAKNINAYINALKKNGSAVDIVKEHKKAKSRSESYKKRTEETLQQYTEIAQTGEAPTENWKQLGEMLRRKCCKSLNSLL